jgi:hypothetical protein
MITPNQLSQNLKKEGVHLTEKELELILPLMVKLAKYEYENYLTNKRQKTDCQSKTKQDIGIIKLHPPIVKQVA